MNKSSIEQTKTLQYAIIGTGAVGGYYGACLQRAGFDVHFLLHNDYQTVRAQGLRIDSLQGSFILPHVRAYNSSEAMPACDVIVVSLKTFNNHLLLKLLPPLLKEESVVLTLQNGLGIEEDIAQIVGEHRVMGGLCFLCANKVGLGHICHLDYGSIRLGDYAPNYQPAGLTPRLKRIADDFSQAGISVSLTADLLQTRWEKLVWNIPFNGLSVVLNATTKEMMTAPATRYLAQSLMEETAQAATAQNRQIAPEFIEKMLKNTAKMRHYKTSMKLDYEKGHPLEIDMIFGIPLKIANDKGISLPRIEMLYQQLQFLSNYSQNENQ